MILFKDWQLSRKGTVFARQYDNLSRVLLVSGVPEGYDWSMLVRVKDHFDVLTLSPMEGGVGLILTGGQLALAGQYDLQLVGTLRSDGMTTRRTNILSVYVSPSLSGDANWPVLPSAFTELEREIKEYAEHPPLPGENSLWLLWDPERQAYVESDFPTVPAGKDGYTPVRGTDYWTDADVGAIQDYIDQRLGVIENGAY